MVRHSLKKSEFTITRWHNAPRWRDFVGSYSKQYYDVKLQDGTIHYHCWPNAGWMNATDGSGLRWSDEDDVKIRKSITHPMGGLQ